MNETSQEDQKAQIGTIDKIFEHGDWLTIEEIDRFQENQHIVKSLASVWKRSGRVFSVPYGGMNYFPRYQFDSLCQPIPIIKEILDIFGVNADPWVVASWFHFPNGWIMKEGVVGAVPVPPKDVLHRANEVISAALNHKGTYLA